MRWRKRKYHKFEFYEYSDDLTTDMTYYGITCDMAPNMEAEERSSHETQVSHDSRLFTFVQDGFYYLAMQKKQILLFTHTHLTIKAKYRIFLLKSGIFLKLNNKLFSKSKRFSMTMICTQNSGHIFTN